MGERLKIGSILHTILFCLIAGFACAQVCPCFTIDKKIGCAPFQINVTSCSEALSVNYYYGEVDVRDDKVTHTYSIPGTFNVRQSSNFNCNGGLAGLGFSDPQPVVVKSVPVPKLSSFPCADYKTLVVASDLQYDEYLVDNTVTIPVKSSHVFTFTDDIPKELAVKGNYIGANCGGSGTITKKAFGILQAPKILDLTVQNETLAVIRFEANKTHRYEVQQQLNGTSGTYIPIDTIDNEEGVYSYQAKLATTSGFACFRIRAFDYCGLKEELSPEFCSILLTGSEQNQANKLNWNFNSLLNSDKYSLLINESPSIGFPARTSPNEFFDSAVVCGNAYCYQLKGTFGSNIVSASNKVCLSAISNTIPPAVEELIGTVADGKVQLSWTLAVAAVKAYGVYFSSDKTTYSQFTASITSTVTDEVHVPVKSAYCYKVDYTDLCDNKPPMSKPSCISFLTGKTDEQLNRILSWTAFSGFSDDLKEYLVEKLDSKGNVYFSQSAGNALAITDKNIDTVEQTLIYRIKAVSVSGKFSYSNTWELKQTGAFFVPNAFTPNEDGLNDHFLAEGLFVQQFSMEIWNRNGEGVYATTSFKNGWDGKINGALAPADTYMYKIEATDKLGVTYKRNGSLQLIR